MIVGEAPGFNEDRQGEPFVGAAGKLLDTLLVRIGLSRADVYITNVLKCRPPMNRDPMPNEAEACSPYLARQLELGAAEGRSDTRPPRDGAADAGAGFDLAGARQPGEAWRRRVRAAVPPGSSAPQRGSCRRPRAGLRPGEGLPR